MKKLVSLICLLAVFLTACGGDKVIEEKVFQKAMIDENKQLKDLYTHRHK